MTDVQVRRIQLVPGDGHRRVHRWRLAGVPHHGQAEVTIGQLSDRRWYATRTGMADQAAAGDEATVRALATEWMDGDAWVETPPN